MRVETELPDPPPGKRWKAVATYPAKCADKMACWWELEDIPAPPRVLYHRTGEYRIPSNGEWYEPMGPENMPTLWNQCFESQCPRWILRREKVAP